MHVKVQCSETAILELVAAAVGGAHLSNCAWPGTKGFWGGFEGACEWGSIMAIY